MQIRFTRSLRAAAVAVAAGVAFLAAGAPAAGADFDFLFSVSHVGDDDQYFLNFTVGSMGYPRAVVQPILPRLRHVEVDLPVVLFLARHSGRPVSVIVDLRSQGLGWSVILGRVGLAPDLLFAGIDRDPGPPYGKAWGYWRKRGRGVALSDGDVAGLVQIQIAARHGGLSAFDLARGHGRGRPVAAALAERKGRPYKGKPAQAGRPAHAGRPEHGGKPGPAGKPGPGDKQGQAGKPDKPRGQKPPH
jgi:hypothetical protein